jgi:hypothetical protein
MLIQLGSLLNNRVGNRIDLDIINHSINDETDTQMNENLNDEEYKFILNVYAINPNQQNFVVPDVIDGFDEVQCRHVTFDEHRQVSWELIGQELTADMKQ